MLKVFLPIVVFFTGIFCAFAERVPVEELPLVPAPKMIESGGKGIFKMPSTPTIAAPKSLSSEAGTLRKILKKRLNVTAKKSAAGTRGTITLGIARRIKNPEAYELKITANGVSITGGSAAGVYYGIRTLEQLFITQKKNLPELKISDEPRFAYRGLMLDPARNFLPAEDVKRFVETMAAYKFNTLHFHLSDDQGWRVEIKNPKYKKLMSVGAQENKPAGTR
ncbi:MAG: family 20 glycosylhydrolase, partial [Opitutales bacterium]|nr:family 20 glycosylhydrolase [Opitutales bacterium]